MESDRMSTDVRRRSGETPRDQLHAPVGQYVLIFKCKIHGFKTDKLITQAHFKSPSNQ
jgi:hypothetical protein